MFRAFFLLLFLKKNQNEKFKMSQILRKHTKCCGNLNTRALPHKKKCTDSYDLIYLSTCYVQLLFSCYYSIGSSVDYQDSVLFCGFSFQ